MWIGNVFTHVFVCLSVCLSVSLFVYLCPFVQAITFEPLHIETSFSICRYIFTTSRSNLSIKVIELKSYEKNDNFDCFNMLLSKATGHL